MLLRLLGSADPTSQNRKESLNNYRIRRYIQSSLYKIGQCFESDLLVYLESACPPCSALPEDHLDLAPAPCRPMVEEYFQIGQEGGEIVKSRVRVHSASDPLAQRGCHLPTSHRSSVQVSCAIRVLQETVFAVVALAEGHQVIRSQIVLSDIESGRTDTSIVWQI